MMKKLMILGASILQLPAIKKAQELGYQVVVVDMNPDAIGFKEEGISKEVISTIDIPLVAEAAKRHKINGIMTLASDMPMRTVATVAKEMNLVGISEETALWATNKAKMREVLKKDNVPVPMFFEVDNEKECLDAVYQVKEAGYKCIIKPVDNSGSEEEKIGAQKWLGIKRERIFLLPNLPATFADTSIHKKNEKFKVVSISRICKTKNILYSIKVVNQLKRETEFDIYGPMEDSEYWNECLEEIKKAPEYIHIRYCGTLTSELSVFVTERKCMRLFLPTKSVPMQ